MDIDGAATVRTTKLEEKALFPELLEILSILAANEIKTVELLFGNAWGIEFGDFTPYRTAVTNVTHEVLHAEFRGFGSLGNDDLLITVGDGVLRILFDRQACIRLYFNRRSDVVNEIMTDWSLKGISYSYSLTGV